MSLRKAVSVASAGDTIEFSPALLSGTLPKTITFAAGPIIITKNLQIVGPGDANGTATPMLALVGSANRIFQVSSPANVTLSGLNLRGGSAAGGGAVLVASGATLNLFECDLTDNTATGGNTGGAILNQGSLIVDQCLFARNGAGNGGAISSTGPLLQVTRSLIESNSATGLGGGIATNGYGFSLESSTVSDNRAGTGGAISFVSTSKTVRYAAITASTVAYNQAGSQSGGLYVEGSGAVATVAGSIFTGNTLANSSGSVSLHDLAVQKSGKINTGDYNIVSKPGTTLSPYGAHDQVNVDPKIGALAYNGGRTRTHVISTGSTAVDRGNPAFSGILVKTDQRSFPRVSPDQGGIADVGAVELTGPTLSIPAEFTFECAGAQTTGTLGALLTLPGGGTATVTWKVNGVAAPSTTITVPANDDTYDLAFDGTFVHGSNTASVRVVTGTYSVERSTVVRVVDTTPPTIKVLGSSPVTLEWGNTYVDAGATATDACDASPTLTVTYNPPYAGSIPPIGTYVITYRAEDDSGNVSTAGRTLHVVDTTKPVIVLNGTTPTTVEWGTTYTDAGATASDNRDGTIPVTVDASAVNTGLVGDYVVNFTATDSQGNQATSTRAVWVRDTIPPILKLAGPPVQTIEWGTPYVELGATAVDLRDGNVTVVIDATGVNTNAVGTYYVRYNATDAAGNSATELIRTVQVVDTTPPVITIAGDSPLTIDWGKTYTDPGATAEDNRDGPVAVTADVPAVNICIPGQYTVTYTATDAAGNTATATRTVVVANTVSLSVSTVDTDVDPAKGTAAIDLSKVVAGMQDTPCDTQTSYNVTIKLLTSQPGQPETYKTIAELKDLESLPTYEFPAGTSVVRIEISLEGANAPLLDNSFTVKVGDPFNVTLGNVAWPHAYSMPMATAPGDGRLSIGEFRQMIARSGESRWFKIHGAPGSRIEVALTQLPANFDLVVYGDIEQKFNELLNLVNSPKQADQTQAILGAQFAQEAYFPAKYAQEAYFQEAYFQEAYFQEAYFQEAYFPEAYTPEAFAQEAYFQEAYFQEAYLPEAYTAAQSSSVVAFSASPNTASETIRFNTYSTSGDFYIRVRGRNGLFSLEAPFQLNVTMLQDLGASITDLNTTPATTPVVSGSPTSLLVWDSARIPGTATEKSALAAALGRFATAANAAVVDVAADSRVAALNAQADANPAVPLAKNLVAETIRNLVRLYRAAAPTIADITLVGSDNTIPFFRTNDDALLASEARYFPPVLDATHSQSSLRLAQVLTQDRYGSSAQVSLATGPYDLPELPVGRLVEKATEVAAYLDAYAPLFNGTATSGQLPAPRTAFISGYEFLADSAIAMRDDMTTALGTGGTIDTLIAATDLPPALGWTADMLRAGFLGTRHDIAYIAGHFSTSGTLAADYRTRMTAAEVLASPTSLLYSLILSSGCHSGYNTVDADAVPLVTEQPDWAQAFARKQALWVSGTGYQYGDTDFIEYTERLQQEFARALRTGSGPIAVGQALVNAKRTYLADTPVMRGIHEKTLVQLTLYGLPMVKLNFAGARLAPPAASTEIAATAPVSGAGATHGLRSASLDFNPTLTRVDHQLNVIGTTSTVVSSYFTGADGIVTVPGEPVRALESFNVSRPNDGFVRGVGFRGGEYSDIAGFVPYLGTPTTESPAVQGKFLSEVLYPIGIWSLNQTAELAGGSGMTELSVFPTQYQSEGPESPTGVLRRFNRLQFSLFYCPESSVTALANPPALNQIASRINGSVAEFSVDAAATLSAGVQEVWVTYTGMPGSPLYGTWRSFTLTAPATSNGVGTWTGSLALSGLGDPGAVRYIVQAVNGVGAVTASTNFGRFFRLGTSTQDEVPAGNPTTVVLQDPIPTQGTYRTSVAVQARLTDSTGQPLASRWLRFSVGASARSFLTDLNGVAAGNLPINSAPDAYNLEVSFAGDTANQNSTASSPFTVNKMATHLRTESTAIVTATSDVVFTLLAADGVAVRERTVLLLFSNNLNTKPIAVITNGAGQVRTPLNGVAPGTYQVTAIFGRSVSLPDGSTVSLSDPLYGPSDAVATVTVTNTLTFHDEQAWLNYNDQTAPGATSGNRGLSSTEIAGDITGPSSSFGPASIMSSTKAKKVSASVRARLSGQTLAEGRLDLGVQSSDNAHWRGEGMINGSYVKVYIDWDDDHGEGRFHAWITNPVGTGPLYNADPAVLEFELILGVGAGEKAAGGSSIIGGTAKPWTAENPNSRVRNP